MSDEYACGLTKIIVPAKRYSSLVTHHASLFLIGPAPDRFDLVVVPHERHDVAGRVADEVLRDVGLVRIDAVLRLRLPRAENRHFAPQIAVAEHDFRADAHFRGVDR